MTFYPPPPLQKYIVLLNFNISQKFCSIMFSLEIGKAGLRVCNKSYFRLYVFLCKNYKQTKRIHHYNYLFFWYILMWNDIKPFNQSNNKITFVWGVVGQYHFVWAGEGSPSTLPNHNSVIWLHRSPASDSSILLLYTLNINPY